MDFEKINDFALYYAILDLQVLPEEKLEQIVQKAQQEGKTLATSLLEAQLISEEDAKRILDHVYHPEVSLSKDAPSFDPNSLVGQKIGKYEIRRLIAQGGMGMVFEGFDPLLQRRVALKLLSPMLLLNPEYRQRFLREARILANLEHPNIVGVYDFGFAQDTLYIAFQYIDGESLEDRILRKPLSVPEALELFHQIASGLEEVHRHRVIHRDIKPANILIRSDGRGMLTDFGIAHVQRSNITSQFRVLGTPMYMPPEILEGKGQDADPRLDIYSFGVTLYVALTGKNPFEAPTSKGIITRHLLGQYTRLSDLGFPKALSQFVESLMARNPADRPKSMAEVCRTLEELKKGKVFSLPSVSFPSLPWRGVVLGGLGVAGALLVGVLALQVPKFISFGERNPSPSGAGVVLEDGRWRELVEKVQKARRKLQLEEALSLLEEEKIFLKKNSLAEWKKLYREIEEEIEGWKRRFQKVDQKAQEVVKKGLWRETLALYQDFQKLDVQDIQRLLRKRLKELLRREREKLEEHYQKALQLLEAAQPQASLVGFLTLRGSLSPQGSTLWKEMYEKLQRRIEVQLQQFWAKGDYETLLQWCQALQEDLPEPLQKHWTKLAREYYRKVEKLKEVFLESYRRSLEYQYQCQWKKAIQVLQAYLSSGKNVPFASIAKKRIRLLQKEQSTYPEGKVVLFAIFREAYPQYLVTYRHTLRVSHKVQKKILELEADTPLRIVLKKNTVVQVEPSSKAALIVFADGLKKGEPIQIRTKVGKTLQGIYLLHSSTDLLFGQLRPASFYSPLKLLGWSEIVELKKN